MTVPVRILTFFPGMLSSFSRGPGTVPLRSSLLSPQGVGRPLNSFLGLHSLHAIWQPTITMSLLRLSLIQCHVVQCTIVDLRMFNSLFNAHNPLFPPSNFTASSRPQLLNLIREDTGHKLYD